MPTYSSSGNIRGRRLNGPRAQRGVVLIIALIMLVVISMLATLSIRNATSSEAVSGNVRTTALASQAAEIALRYCEDAAVQIQTGFGTKPLPLPPAQGTSTVPTWQSLSNWDAINLDVYVIPDAYVNSATGPATFRRLPECMIQRMQVLNSAGAWTTTSTYVITARGFGPEVAAADTARSRPIGSEVWLQSTIELQ